MESVTKYAISHPLLKPLISSVVFWRRSDKVSESKIFLPNNISGFGFTLSGEFYLKRNNELHLLPTFGTRNVLDKPSEVLTKGNFLNISVRFIVPNGLYLFTKTPMNVVYEQQAISLNDLFKPQEIKDLNEQLLFANSDSQKMMILETFMANRIIHQCPPMLSHIITFIQTAKGICNVTSIAKKFALTERSINRYFNKYIGISPITYIHLTRFRSVLSLTEISDLKSFANSFDLGYYDQSHFIKHFKEFTTVTPTQFQHSKKKNKLSDFYNL